MTIRHVSRITAFAVGILALGAGTALAQTCQPKVAVADLVTPGKLTMSTNPTLPPLQYVNEKGELQGMRVELGIELAKRLCLTPETIRIDFQAMVPGLQAGRWDMINTGIFYTEERAKIMHMVHYEDQAISISVQKGKAAAIKKPEDMAGRTISVEVGGFEERRTKELSEMLVKQGLKAMEIRTFNNFADAFQALRAGQVEAELSIDATAKFYQDRGDFERALSGLFPTPVTVAFKNGNLAKAVQAAFIEMKKDGYYDGLFAKYGLPPVPEADMWIKGPTN